MTLCTALVSARCLQGRATENPCAVLDENRERTLNQKESTGNTGTPPQARKLLTLGQFGACQTQARRPQSATAQKLFLIAIVLCLVWNRSPRCLRESSNEETHEKDWTVTIHMPSRDKASIQFLLQRPQSWEAAHAFGSQVREGTR